MEEKRGRKYFAIIMFIVLLGIDALLFQKTGGILRGLRRMKTHRLLILFILNAAAALFLFFPEGLRKKLCSTRVMKIINLVTLTAFPAFLFFVTQLILSKGQFMITNEYLGVNLLIYYLLFLMIFLLVGRGNISVLLYGFIVIVLTMVNYYVLAFRGTPFMILDILSAGTAMEVTEGYNFGLSVMMSLRLLALVVYLSFQMTFQTIRLGKNTRKNLCIRFGVFALLLCFSLSGGLKIAQAETISMWDTINDYREKGYLYSLICETRYIVIEEPENYSPESAVQIAEEAEGSFREDSSAAPKTVPENLIIVMNESFTDFGGIDSIATSEEMLPYWKSLSQRTSSGYLHVPSYGGGTADSEYEVLTGNTKQFLPASSIAYQLYIQKEEYGLADILKSQGYSATAIHPFLARGWNRPSVYSNMGFDRFISMDTWEEEFDKLRNYATDLAAYEKIIKLYNEKEPGEKMFQFCVTMQNHGGYGPEKANGYEPEITLSYDTEYPTAEMFLSLIQHSDEDLEKLISYFEKVEEPTMIVMFGDHWPNMDWGFLNEIFGKDFASLDPIEYQRIRQTPYIIWTNYPSEIIHQDMSANYFGSYILQQAGLELSTYNKFLLQLKEKLPVIGSGMVKDAQDNWYALDSLPSEYQELIDQYRILQYNNISDRKNRDENVFR